MREKFPDRRHTIEVLRGRLYIKRGLFEPASRISAVLMSEKRTELGGWALEAEILAHRGRPYEAHHLFAEVCKRRPDDQSACYGAISTIVATGRSKAALQYLQAQYPRMRQHPNTAYQFWLHKAAVLRQLGDIPEAISSARRALGFKRNDRTALSTLIRLHVELGDRDAANNAMNRLAQSTKDTRTDKLYIELATAVTELSGRLRR